LKNKSILNWTAKYDMSFVSSKAKSVRKLMKFTYLLSAFMVGYLKILKLKIKKVFIFKGKLSVEEPT